MMGFGVKRSLKSGFIQPDSLRASYFQYYRISVRYGAGDIFGVIPTPPPSGARPHSFPRRGPVPCHLFLMGTRLGGGWGGGLGGDRGRECQKTRTAPGRWVGWSGERGRKPAFSLHRIHILLLAPPTSQLPGSRSALKLNIKIKLHINITRFHTTEITLAKLGSAQFTTLLNPLGCTELLQPLNA